MNKNIMRRGSANGTVDAEIKFAGNDNKIKMYEPKHKKKLIRVLTVVAYLISVSLAAIMLSLFYIFIYSPGKSPAGNLKELGIQPLDQKSSKMIDESTTIFNDTYSELEREEPRALPLSDADKMVPTFNEQKIKSAKRSLSERDSVDENIRKINFLKSIKVLNIN